MGKTKEVKQVRVSITLDPELITRAEKHQKKNYMKSFSDVMSQALVMYLNYHGGRK